MALVVEGASAWSPQRPQRKPSALANSANGIPDCSSAANPLQLKQSLSKENPMALRPHLFAALEERQYILETELKALGEELEALENEREALRTWCGSLRERQKHLQERHKHCTGAAQALN